MRKLGKAPECVLFTLEGHYPEIPQVGGNPLLRMYRRPKISLMELAEQFRMVAEDPRVKGVVIHLRPLDLPLAKLDVLRGLIDELRQAGKRVIIWSYTYDTGMYYLASSADEISAFTWWYSGTHGVVSTIYLFGGCFGEGWV